MYYVITTTPPLQYIDQHLQRHTVYLTYIYGTCVLYFNILIFLSVQAIAIYIYIFEVEEMYSNKS